MELKYYKVDFIAKVYLLDNVVNDRPRGMIECTDNSTFTSVNVLDNTLEFFTDKDTIDKLTTNEETCKKLFDKDDDVTLSAIITDIEDKYNSNINTKIKIDGKKIDIAIYSLKGYIVSDIKNRIRDNRNIILDKLYKIFKR